jgi:uncharacterized protein DUF1579
MRIRLVLLALVGLIPTPLVALQNQSQRPCSTPQFRQLDFWVGDWDLTWPASQSSQGKPGRGKNHIERALDDCVVVERFDGSPGMPLRGMSVSTFDQRAGKWRQTWVDNSGGYLDFVGGLKDGSMILTREAAVPAGRKILQRMVWKNIEADSLDWSWENSADGGQTWTVLWPVHYQRVRTPGAAPSPGKKNS